MKSFILYLVILFCYFDAVASEFDISKILGMLPEARIDSGLIGANQSLCLKISGELKEWYDLEKPSNMVEFNSTFTLGDNLKLRYLSDNYSMLRRGKKTYNKNILEIIYDGETWYTYEKSASIGETELDVKQLSISDDPPNYLGNINQAYFFGGAFWIDQIAFVNDLSLSEVLKAPPSFVEITVNEDDGEFVVYCSDVCTERIVRFSQEGTIEELAFTLNKCNSELSEVVVKFEYTNYQKFENINVSLPTRLVRTYMSNGEIINRAEVSLKSLSVEICDESNWEQNVPPGWTVVDKRNGLLFRTGQSKEETLRSLKQLKNNNN